jgi:protein-tyrosine kinase
MTARHSNPNSRQGDGGTDVGRLKHAVGFVWRGPRRHPKTAATLFLAVAVAGLGVAAVLRRTHDARIALALGLGSLLAGVLAAFLGTLAMDWRAGVLLERWQVTRLLKIDVLGELESDLMQAVVGEFSPHVLKGFTEPATALGWPVPDEAPIEAPTGMASPEQVDNFRELRTRLLTIAADAELPRFTTLVVPLVSGSGASFVARNLAASFTFQDGVNVLLIDCNMTHPTQHVALGVNEDGGLFDFLDEPYVRFTPKPTAIRNLFLVPSGRSRAPFREYFSSNRMRSLMRVIRESGGFVFLDGPPVTGSPDARILSELVDLVILVIGYGKGTAEDIAKAAAMFDPAKFAGVVVNERPCAEEQPAGST